MAKHESWSCLFLEKLQCVQYFWHKFNSINLEENHELQNRQHGSNHAQSWMQMQGFIRFTEQKQDKPQQQEKKTLSANPKLIFKNKQRVCQAEQPRLNEKQQQQKIK